MVSLIGDYRQQGEDQGSSWGRFVTSAREGPGVPVDSEKDWVKKKGRLKNTKEGQHDREGYYDP